MLHRGSFSLLYTIACTGNKIDGCINLMSSGYDTLHVGHWLEILWGKSLPAPRKKGGRELITVPGLPEGMCKSLCGMSTCNSMILD